MISINKMYDDRCNCLFWVFFNTHFKSVTSLELRQKKIWTENVVNPAYICRQKKKCQI